MALFQPQVERQYLASISTDLKPIYDKFIGYFGNVQIQENILQLTEEQFQGEFIRALFVDVLGYISQPEPNFNLLREKKNENDAKSADGAIIINNQVVGVIELKDRKTQDLKKVEIQAFGYKNNHRYCRYVITSNFQKLRFYIDDAVEFIEFDLFKVGNDDPKDISVKDSESSFDLFKRLWLCLSFESISLNLPQQIKEQSTSKEDDITIQLYKDYSAFKRELFENIVARNPDFDKLLLFKKTQKLLDRYLFLFFAEDKGLLPANSVQGTVEKWMRYKDDPMNDYQSLYSRFIKYFHLLNVGYKDSRTEIFAYNGGLFAPDEILKAISIDDEILAKNIVKLAQYNYDTDVDVNILGHIFENSLNEIEEVTTEITTGVKTTSKRKQDGVFYTPRYITKYIVENTVGKLCEEKKTEFGINASLFEFKRKDKKKQALLQLEQYREWLLQITICDPACGSGAFLNMALEFLILEHKLIDEMVALITGSSLVFEGVENTILENNIFGVDINDESVEIAKLSLWLRTAKPRRKLTSLNNNIKCGNSLIDNPELAGDKAFDWQKEFPHVFAKGGFDCVIGNPPYVQLQTMGEMSDTLCKCGYESYHRGADLYCLFTERGYKLLNSGGIQSFIMPNKWMLVAYGKPLRNFLSKTGLRQLLNFGDVQFFQDATTYVCIFVTQKSEPCENVKVLSLNKKNYHGDFLSEVETNIYSYSTTKFGESEWSIQPYADSIKLEQMKKNGIELKDLPINTFRGILTGYNDAFYIDEVTRQKLIAADAKSAEIIKPMVRGRDIAAYGITGFEYLIGTFPALNFNIENYPAIKEHLLSFGFDRLKQTGDKGARKKTSGQWFETQDSIKYYKEFSKPKIIYPNMTSVFPFMYDESGILGNQKCFILTAQNETISLGFLSAVFNSSLAKLWIWYNCPELQGGTREISKVYFEHFPVPQANQEQTEKLAQLAQNRIQLTADLTALTTKFNRNIQREYNLVKLSNKLDMWYQLPFANFLKELAKSKVKLTLAQKADIEDYFNTESVKVQAVKTQIDQTDRTIDAMVYQLYGLSELEIE